MNIKRMTALGATLTALSMPTAAIAAKPDTAGGGKDKTAPSQAKAYGKYCKGESKENIKGDGLKGTAFSRCVKAAAQAAKTARTDEDVSARKAAKQACKTGFAKQRTQADKDADLKGTAYSRCIVAAAQAHKDAQTETQS